MCIRDRLYDFASLGYLTLARDGTILQANLTATKLLGVERSLLVGDRFERFVATEDLPYLNALLESVFKSDGHVSCEVKLHNNEVSHLRTDNPLFQKRCALPDRMVRIDAVVSCDGQECRATVSEICKVREVLERDHALNT